MIDLFKEYKFKYEEKNTFNNGSYSCYYCEKENGFAVFFIINKESNEIDYAVYNSKKKLVIMIHQIYLIIKDIEDQRLFISRTINEPYNHNYRIKTR